LTVPRFVDCVKENRKSMLSQADLNNEFHKGVIYACEYFRDELGIEDAMETDIAHDALNMVTIDE